LSDDPQYADVLARLAVECEEWMKRTGDLGLLPEYEMHRRAAGRTPWDVARDCRANPIERLLAAAGVANEMDVERLGDLTDMLESDEPAVRFWAATGLAALGQQAAPASTELIAALQDPAPNVRIAAAEALCKLDRVGDALPVLIASLRHETPFIRLRAMNVLDDLGEMARPALPAMKAAKMENRSHVNDYLGRMAQYVPAKFKQEEE
jgi:HEAT repeat protein